jgi:hypothetical protein
MNPNLIPIRPGEKRALKPEAQRRTVPLKIMLTPAEAFSFAARAKAEEEKTMSKLARRLLGL